MLPQISPAPLTSLKEPIGHPNWVYVAAKLAAVLADERSARETRSVDPTGGGTVGEVCARRRRSLLKVSRLVPRWKGDR